MTTLHISLCNGQNIILEAEGKNSFETEVIDSLNYKKNHSNLKELNDEVKKITNSLQKKGFIDALLVSKEKINDSTFLATFNLNEKYNDVFIYNYDGLFNKEELKSISSKVTSDYFIITIPEIENTLNYLNNLLIANGSPFSSLRLTGFTKTKEKNLKAELNFDNQERRTIDSIILKGYDKFPKSYLKHFINLKTKKVFDLEEIKSKTIKLEELGFVKQTKSPEVLFTKENTSVYLYLEKKKSNSFDGFLGFGTNETTNKIEFDGYLNLLLNNNLNFGETLTLQYKSDENEQKTLDINIDLPYLLKSPIGISANLNIFKKDSSFTNASQNVKLNYLINSNNTINIGYTNISSNTLSTNILENTEDFSSNFFTTSYTYKKRNPDLIFNRYNWLTNLTLGFGNRSKENQNVNQTLASLSSHKVFKLNNKNSIYIKIDAKALLSDSYLENELYRFGGINSIRGFEENSLLASKFGVLNTEYRYNLSSNIYIHTILDASYFENDIIKSKEKLFGFGAGFALKTRAGLFKFIYANGKTENQKFNLSNSKIHISLNAVF